MKLVRHANVKVAVRDAVAPICHDDIQINFRRTVYVNRLAMPRDKDKYSGFCADENQLSGYPGPRTGNFLIKF
jgi:hypothetical protein